MAEDEANLEGNVNESYSQRKNRVKPFAENIPKIEFQQYFQAMSEYNALTGKENPEQKAAAETGLLVMANVLGRLKDTPNRFLYAMAETLFRDYAKKEAGWNDEKIEAYFKKVEESPKSK